MADRPEAGRQELPEHGKRQGQAQQTKEVPGVQAQTLAALKRPPFGDKGLLGKAIRVGKGVFGIVPEGGRVSAEETSEFVISVHAQVNLEARNGKTPTKDSIEKIINDRVFAIEKQGQIDLWFGTIGDFGSVPFFKTRVETRKGHDNFGKRVDEDGTVVGVRIKNTVTDELIPDNDLLDAMFTIRSLDLDPTVELIQDIYDQYLNQPQSKRQ